MTILVLLACGLVFISYGSIAYAIFTERPGMNGNLYWYYRADKTVFGLYMLIIALGALTILIRLLYFAFQDNAQKVTRTFIHFAIWLLILIISEVYLNSLYVGKG
jgi:hypothetical protein